MVSIDSNTVGSGTVGSTTETSKDNTRYLYSQTELNNLVVLPSGTHSTFFLHGPLTGHKTPTLVSLQTVPFRQTTRAQPAVPRV